MGPEGVGLVVYLAFFVHLDNQEYQVVVAGFLGDLPLLYFSKL